MHRKTEALADDALIAATALANDLTIATRNVRDFRYWDVRLHNPFGAQAQGAPIFRF